MSIPNPVKTNSDALERLVINLKSRATFSSPPELAQGFAGASPEDLAEVEVTPSSNGLHWEKLDADFSVPALLAGVFGTEVWMDQIKMRLGYRSHWTLEGNTYRFNYPDS